MLFRSGKGKKEEVVVKKEEKKVLKPLPEGTPSIMADLSKKQAFKKFQFRGKEIGPLLNMNVTELSKLFRSRQRRRLKRKLRPEYGRLLNKLNFIKTCTPQGEKPLPVKTHLRDLIVMPSMVLSNVNVHTGNSFAAVEVKPDMIGYYLGEFAMSYKKVSHGKPGVGATAGSKNAPLK